MSSPAPFAMKFIGLALALSTLAACNQITAEPAEPQRPVLVTAVHYQRQSADRSFVGTVRPRIESDLGGSAPPFSASAYRARSSSPEGV